MAVTSPDSGSATVSWGPPAYDGGNPVASYQVSASPGGAACTSTDLSDLSCTVSGLSPATSYTFWVTATSPSGTGPGGYASLFASGCVPAPGSDLVGCDFTDLNLSGDDFDGADLAAANFTDANLTDASLTNADLTYDTFTDVTLDGADLTGASLDINGHAYGGMSAVATTFPAGFGVVGGYLVGPGANISGVDFSGGDFTGVTLSSDVLNNDNFSGADLSGVDLDRSDLTGSNLTDADLTGSNLTDANLTYDGFTDATLNGVVFDDTVCPDGSNSSNDNGTCLNNL